MVMQLMVIAGPDKGLAIPLNEEGTVRVGRSQSILTRLTDPHVSRVHCELQVAEGKVVLMDSNSAHGTFVNGKKIARQPLRAGDIIQVGATQLRYDNTDVESETSTIAPEAGLVAKAPAPACATLEGLVGQTISRYEIRSQLAKGKSGIVFHAHEAGSFKTGQCLLFGVAECVRGDAIR